MLTGELTNLRALDREDLDRIVLWLDDPELMRWWGYGAAVSSPSAVRARIEDWIGQELAAGHPTAFVIDDLERRSIGLLILSDVQLIDRSAELSLFLLPEFRGRGYGADALEALCDAAFEQWNLHRLTVRNEEHNAGAREFFLRHGFEQEGRLREARFIDGEWRDILIFGRVRDKEPNDS